MATARGRATLAASLLALLVVLLTLAPTAGAATSRAAAAEKALAALGVEQSIEPVIVFGLPSTLKPGTVIREAGATPGAVAARKAAASAFARKRLKRIAKAGVTIRGSRLVLVTGSEPVWFFHEDQGPNQAFAHPGRIVTVGARTGKVRISRRINWVPLIGNKPPAFFRNAQNYESDRYRVFDRPWSAEAAARRARTRQAADTPAGPRQAVADALAAEKSCALRISDTLGDFYDFGRVDQTRARLGLFFEGLEKLNAGFVSRRYTTSGARTPIQTAQDLIDNSGCRDLFVYTAGAASPSGDAAIVIGMRPVGGGRMEWHILTAKQLEKLVKDNPSVTFKFLFDFPYSNRVNTLLIDEPNMLLLLSSGGPAEQSFTFLPGLLGPERPPAERRQPEQLLEFTNAILTGLEAFVRTRARWPRGTAVRAPATRSWRG